MINARRPGFIGQDKKAVADFFLYNPGQSLNGGDKCKQIYRWCAHESVRRPVTGAENVLAGA